MAASQKYIPFVLFIVQFLDIVDIRGYEEIVISQGRIRGTTLTTRKGRNFVAFLGIPYAKPPVGSLRFKNPLPADSWNGTFVADRDGNPCPQLDEDDKVIGDEDCLFLNVYTPQTSPNVSYPTIVFIHGGGFIKGEGGSTYVAPGFVMDRDVVLVGLNYRLGVLGFLSTGDLAASGNFGLKDQVLALRWVKQNIRAFGGDPERVTLVGQSAGSVSVNLHALSDASAGLFHQYVTHSGSAFCFWAYRDITTYKDRALDLGRYFNCPMNNSEVMIECLRQISARDLVNTTDLFGNFLNLISTWTPTNEPEHVGAFLTSSPVDRILQNKLRDYPWISSNVANEGLAVTAEFYGDEELYLAISQNISSYLEFIAEKYLGVDNPKRLASEVEAFYFGKEPTSDSRLFLRYLTNLITDAAFLFPGILHMQMALKNMKSPFYFYSLDYRGTYSGTEHYLRTKENIGVSHTDDLIYLFPSEPDWFHVKEISMSEYDNYIIDVMIDFWASFAYNGTPTSSHLSDPYMWKPYDNNMTYLQIGQNTNPSILLRKKFRFSRMHFWLMQLLKINILRMFAK